MPRSSSRESGTAEVPCRNEVVLVGRVAAVPQVREMPSGDEMTTFRVVVDRPPAARRTSRVRVDALECVAWSAAARRSAGALQPDDVVEVSGALRRRFQRSGGAATSRIDVEVSRCRRLRVANRASARRRPAVPSDA